MTPINALHHQAESQSYASRPLGNSQAVLRLLVEGRVKGEGLQCVPPRINEYRGAPR